MSPKESPNPERVSDFQRTSFSLLRALNPRATPNARIRSPPSTLSRAHLRTIRAPVCVIKLNNAHTAGRTLVPSLAKLRDQCSGDPRIRIIDETLGHAEVLCLYASCDAFVSLHRSEGFGFGLIETMALGKPVIATAWSGNMAFMNQTNSCLVGYKLIPVDANLPALTAANFSAERLRGPSPDLEQAAAWMRKLVDDPEVRISLGERAAMDMAEFQKEARKAKFVDEICAVWQNAAFLPRRSMGDKLKGLQEVERALLRQRGSAVPYGKRLRDQIRRVADKHILWRFR